jgi:hypothetical protein
MDKNRNDTDVLLIPRAYDFEALQTLASIKTLIGLHAYRTRGGEFTFPYFSVRKFAEMVQLYKTSVYDALSDLSDRKLIFYIPRKNAAAFVALCDPAGSGTLIDTMLDTDSAERDDVYTLHDEGHWYRELVGIDIQLDPQAYEYGRVRQHQLFSGNCPFCGRIDAKRRDFRFSVEVRRFDDGHSAHWKCYRCGEHGDCRKLFDRLWIKRKEQEARDAELAKTFFPEKKAEPLDESLPY